MYQNDHAQKGGDMLTYHDLITALRPGLDAMYFLRPWSKVRLSMEDLGTWFEFRPLPELMDSILADFKTAAAPQHRQAQNFS